MRRRTDAVERPIMKRAESVFMLFSPYGGKCERIYSEIFELVCLFSTLLPSCCANPLKTLKGHTARKLQLSPSQNTSRLFSSFIPIQPHAYTVNPVLFYKRQTHLQGT